MRLRRALFSPSLLRPLGRAHAAMAWGVKGAGALSIDRHLVYARANSSVAAVKAISAGLHSEGTAVAIKFSDSTSHKFHAIWLRDHCRCPSCTHATTLQRLVDTLSIPANIKPEGAEVIDEGRAVRVLWSSETGGAQHESVFSASWLAANAYSTASSPAAAPAAVSSGPSASAAEASAEKQRRLHDDPAAPNPSTVTAWTAHHFGSRKAADKDRSFPSIPFSLFMGSAEDKDYDSLLSSVPAYQSPQAAENIKAALAASRDSIKLKRSLGLHRALSLLHRYGFVRVEGVPVSEKATEQVCKRIGPLMGTLYDAEEDKEVQPGVRLSRHMWRTEVLADGGNDTAYTGIALPAHVDGCYLQDVPGLQVFHALKADADNGGDSLLVDGFSVAEHLRRHHPDTFAFLCQQPFPYHHTDPAHVLFAQHTVIQLDKNTGNLVGFRFNNDDRAPLVNLSASGVGMPTAYVHLRRLIETMRLPQHELWMPLRPGTVLIFNNQRVMHGRASFSVKSGRVLSGTYLAADTWMSRLRATSQALGLYKPSLAL